MNAKESGAGFRSTDLSNLKGAGSLAIRSSLTFQRPRVAYRTQIARDFFRTFFLALC